MGRLMTPPNDWSGRLKKTVAATIFLIALGVGCGTPSATSDAPPSKEAIQQGNELVDAIGIRLALIPAGEFLMGSGTAEQTGIGDRWPEVEKAGLLEVESPQHRISITRAYYFGVYEVTFAQFQQFVVSSAYKTEAETDGGGGWAWDPSVNDSKMAAQYNWRNVGWEQTDSHPVVNVSWNDAVAFCKWVSEREGAIYRLPTEAEWEYACRAGSTTMYWNGDDPEGLSRVGNAADLTVKGTFPDWTTIASNDGYFFPAPVGQFPANPWGLHDMHGNVWEWTSDWFNEGYYSASPGEDPRGPEAGTMRVMRGGSWDYGPAQQRSAGRHRREPSQRVHNLGFRVLREVQ